MFISNAIKYLGNGFFIAKMVLIAIAGLNMLIFHFVGARDLPKWETIGGYRCRRVWPEVCRSCCGLRW